MTNTEKVRGIIRDMINNGSNAEKVADAILSNSLIRVMAEDQTFPDSIIKCGFGCDCIISKVGFVKVKEK